MPDVGFDVVGSLEVGFDVVGCADVGFEADGFEVVGIAVVGKPAHFKFCIVLYIIRQCKKYEAYL